MRPEYGDFAKAQKAKREEKLRVRIPNLELLSQAQIKAEHVTGHDAWDTYLTWVQAAAEKAKEYMNHLDTMLADPMVVGHDELMRLKVEREACRARIEAWEAAIELPKQIIEQGEKARNTLIDLAGAEDDERAA